MKYEKEDYRSMMGNILSERDIICDKIFNLNDNIKMIYKKIASTSELKTTIEEMDKELISLENKKNSLDQKLDAYREKFQESKYIADNVLEELKKKSYLTDEEFGNYEEVLKNECMFENAAAHMPFRKWGWYRGMLVEKLVCMTKSILKSEIWTKHPVYNIEVSNYGRVRKYINPTAVIENTSEIPEFIESDISIGSIKKVIFCKNYSEEKEFWTLIKRYEVYVQSSDNLHIYERYKITDTNQDSDIIARSHYYGNARRRFEDNTDIFFNGLKLKKPEFNTKYDLELSDKGNLRVIEVHFNNQNFKENSTIITQFEKDESDGYLKIKLPEMPENNNDIDIYQLVAESWLEKPEDDCIYDIHHIDNDGHKNTPENLIYLKRCQHTKAHPDISALNYCRAKEQNPKCLNEI